jgi:excinuclease ABC subunit A
MGRLIDERSRCNALHMRSDAIEVEAASTHNLKSVTCSFPHRRMTVVTGVSGSGKSSLAFDTVYAEGQRRYVETLSTYARQFLEQMSRPPVKAVRHVPPALALAQGNGMTNARSSVSSVTEVDDHLRLLYAAAGETFCASCGDRVERFTPARVQEVMVEAFPGERAVVIATVRPEAGESPAELLRQLGADGFRRVEVGGDLVTIDSEEALGALEDDAVRVVVDRVQIEAGSSRLVEAVEVAFRLGDCLADVVVWNDERPARRFHDHLRCAACGRRHLDPVPALFDRSSSVGACGTCGGYGRTVGIDYGRVVPDPTLSIADGAIAPFQSKAMRHNQRSLMAACRAEGIDTETPWMDLAEEDRRRILGRGFGQYDGVRGFFGALEEDRYKPHIRIFMARYRGFSECQDCDGTGLSEDARAVRVAGKDLGSLERLRVEEALSWMKKLELPSSHARALEPLTREIISRLGFLDEAGVGYLSLNRPSRTLSGGEMHRVLLATSVGRSLTDTCYVLDEPTAGLHPEDTERLMAVVERLRDNGNTLIVVEHDPDVIARADHVVELGPAGGERGGTVVFEGNVEGLRAARTATGEALRSAPSVPPILDEPERFLSVTGACVHNLRDVSARFPIGRMSVVTGVSGSGKSTLVGDVLCEKLRGSAPPDGIDPLARVAVTGAEFSEVVLVDQAAISRSSRSCAVTLSGAYGPIRDRFAAQDEAKRRKLTAGSFSFNASGGRCERCEGTGVRIVEMHFMADVVLECDVCGGRRFGPDALSVRYRDVTIADVLEMSVEAAIEVFSDVPAVVRALEPLRAVGLGYLVLGQPTSQLSGGELQRVKLASYVSGTGGDAQRLFIFDEPTVGLHVQDVRVLLDALRTLVDAGNTVIAVEHNLDFISACDWIVDLGPGAGPAGGKVVYEGPVAGAHAVEASVTGRHLARSLDPRSSAR